MTKIEELKQAKINVIYLLEHIDSLIDMHGLSYWAERVWVRNVYIKF